MNINLKWAALLATATLVAGCASVADPTAPPAGSPLFRDGFRSGCQSGKAEADVDMDLPGYEQDARKYGVDTDYRSGWDLGYHRCYDDYLAHTPMINGN
jgi:hypothetical protein